MINIKACVNVRLQWFGAILLQPCKSNILLRKVLYNDMNYRNVDDKTE